MYKNTGSKIIALANIIAVIGMILAVFIGIISAVIIGSEYGGGFGFLALLSISGIGCGMAWLSSLLLAGLGELISNTSEMLSVAKHSLTIAVNSSPNAVDYITVEKNNSSPTGTINTYATPQGSAKEHPLKPIDNEDGKITCPRCSTSQPSDRDFCNKCGRAFT